MIPDRYICAVCHCTKCDKYYIDSIDPEQKQSKRKASAAIRILFTDFYRTFTKSPDECYVYRMKCADCTLRNAPPTLRNLFNDTVRRGE